MAWAITAAKIEVKVGSVRPDGEQVATNGKYLSYIFLPRHDLVFFFVENDQSGKRLDE